MVHCAAKQKMLQFYNTIWPHLFWKIFIDFLTSMVLRAQNTMLLSKVKRRFFSNFVAFSENPNFTISKFCFPTFIGIQNKSCMRDSYFFWTQLLILMTVSCPLSTKVLVTGQIFLTAKNSNVDNFLPEFDMANSRPF